MTDNASKCMVNGSLPLGFVRGSDGRYAVDEAEATVVREIFQRVLNGDKFSEIISDLNARCIKTKVGKPWNKSSFNRLVTNERYAGVYIYGETRIEGGIPQIIDRATFDAVQAKLHSKANPRKSDNPQRRRRDDSIYLLTGKLFCGHCKAPMVGISGKSQGATPYYYYVCKGKRTNHSCDKKNVRREYIEAFVATALRDTMLTDTAIVKLAHAAVEYQNAHRDLVAVDSLRNQLRDVETRIGNITDAIEAGIFTSTTQKRLMALEAEQRNLTAQLSLAREEAEQGLTLEEMIAAMEIFKNGDVTDKSYQEALIDTFLVAAYVYDDTVKFVFRIGDHDEDLTVPFDIDDVEFAETCITSATLHQMDIGRTSIFSKAVSP